MKVCVRLNIGKRYGGRKRRVGERWRWIDRRSLTVIVEGWRGFGREIRRIYGVEKVAWSGF